MSAKQELRKRKHGDDSEDDLIEQEQNVKYILKSTSSKPEKPNMIRKKENLVITRIKKLPIKTTVIATLMFTFGIFFLGCGLACLEYCDDRSQSISWFFVGSVILIPGSWVLFTICMVVFYPEKGYTLEGIVPAGET